VNVKMRDICAWIENVRRRREWDCERHVPSSWVSLYFNPIVLFSIGPPSFPPSAMAAPTNVAVPLPVGEKPIAKPKKQPYPFWLGGN
jgi:hypothetical protein